MSKEENYKKIEERYSGFAQEVLETGETLPVNVDGMAPETGKGGDRLADRLYSEDELEDLPEAAVGASIGCGNPLALEDVLPGETILDLGSGGGIDCFMAAKAVGPDGSVIGVDASPRMIELANQNKAKMGVEQVEFRHGQIEVLPVESSSIDLIISNCVIDISPDKEAVFREAYRVLKPGGRIAISDTVIMGEISSKLKENIDQWAGAVVTPLISLKAFLTYMKRAGFTGIEVQSLTSYGLENFENLDAESQKLLTNGVEWTPLPPQTGLYSAAIKAGKPY